MLREPETSLWNLLPAIAMPAMKAPTSGLSPRSPEAPAKPKQSMIDASGTMFCLTGSSLSNRSNHSENHGTSLLVTAERRNHSTSVKPTERRTEVNLMLSGSEMTLSITEAMLSARTSSMTAAPIISFASGVPSCSNSPRHFRLIAMLVADKDPPMIMPTIRS